ncbi:hypothetical protein BKA62DRAFT_296918 [Auriculariales sp. MPI-PUGE-AT-0066]|nr:hypothetical protein BKA62DRAFT_296918 [Auriculariales sp. MPI-PUGE-AT-0066]
MAAVDMALLRQRLIEFETLALEQLDNVARNVCATGRPAQAGTAFEQVRSDSRELEAGLGRIALRIMRQTNTMAPINRLPLELLERIFETLVLVPGQAMVGVILSQVCKSWRQIALDYSGLWRNISITRPRTLRALSVLLSRAKFQPTDLRLSLTDVKGNEEHAMTAIQCLAQHLSHIESLTITFDPEYRKPLFRRLCEAAGPILRRLSLSCTQFSSRYPLPGNVFNGKAPELTYLELSHISPMNLGKAFQGIKTLELWRSCVTVEALRRISTFCPLVEDITMQGWEGFSPRPVLPQQQTQLQFEALDQVTFVDLRIEVVTDILQHLNCDSINAIKIKSGPTSKMISHLPLLSRMLDTLGPVVEALIGGHLLKARATEIEPTRRMWRITVFDREDFAREMVFEEPISVVSRGALNPDGRLLRAVRKMSVDARCWAPFVESIDTTAPALGALKILVPDHPHESAVLWHTDALLQPVADAKQPLKCAGLRRLTLRAARRVEVSAESVLKVLDGAIDFANAKLPELKLKNVIVKQGMGLEILRERVEELIM